MSLTVDTLNLYQTSSSAVRGVAAPQVTMPLPVDAVAFSEVSISQKTVGAAVGKVPPPPFREMASQTSSLAGTAVIGETVQLGMLVLGVKIQRELHSGTTFNP